ncbi:hypothetical protein Tco_1285689 [Tanacetum coccineum]
MSTPIDFSGYILNGLNIKNLTQEILLGSAFRLLKGTRSNYAELEYEFKECYKDLSEKLDWENPKGGDYPFDLSKPLPLITRGKHQRVPFEFFINNYLKYLQGGISTMTYMTSTTKTKAAKYDLPGIEDMVPNIWSPVKVAYDRYALWGISHWRQQRKSFYAYARGIQSRGDVYSTKRILAVTHVKVMRKHGYRYLEEIVVRRADNVLYRFKEGNFPRLQINDIEDKLILMVQNRLTNLSGYDVADFAIALRMFTRSLDIDKEYFAEEKKSNVQKKRDYFYMTSTTAKGKEEMRIWRNSIVVDSTELVPSDCCKTIRLRHIVFILSKVIRIAEPCDLHRYSNPMIQPELEGSTQGYPLVSVEVLRFDTSAGNPVKEILLKLNLPDHRSILTDSKEYVKMVMERQSVKVKEIQERCIIKAFQDYQIKKGMSMSVQKSQVHEMAKFTRWRNEIMLG